MKFTANATLGVTLPSGSIAQAFYVKILLSIGLMFVITAIATYTKAVGQLAAIMIGTTVLVNALSGCY